jgi:hypothetical protein
MPDNPPLLASGPREPKKPRPLPARVKTMIGLMVRGDPGDDSSSPLDFIAAGRQVGMAPDVARRWLDRGEFRQALRAERRAFRDAICAGNEASLARIRDTSENAMAQVRAIQVLEKIDDEAARAPVGRTPGMVIQIVNAPTLSEPVTIDHHAPRTLPPLADRNS